MKATIFLPRLCPSSNLYINNKSAHVDKINFDLAHSAFLGIPLLVCVVLLADLLYLSDHQQMLRGLLFINPFYYGAPSLLMSLYFSLQRQFLSVSFKSSNFSSSSSFLPRFLILSQFICISSLFLNPFQKPSYLLNVLVFF